MQRGKNMTKVITYGTYDMLHYGHIHLLERAKKLGDYLIVAVTSDDFDKARGKFNVSQSLPERIAALQATGIANEIIVEEYEGQKIDDIRRYDVDIFTIGSDWVDKYDYLNEYCKVVYLDRTEGISSSQIRANDHKLKIGLVGDTSEILSKFAKECLFVNGTEVVGSFGSLSSTQGYLRNMARYLSYEKLLADVDAVYLAVNPNERKSYIEIALEHKKHILCDPPISIKESDCKELFYKAKRIGCVLMEGNKTAYALAFERLMLLLKSGIIGEIVSVEATSTSLRNSFGGMDSHMQKWGSVTEWGPFAMLPIFMILGCDYKEKSAQSRMSKEGYDAFTKINFIYNHAIGSIKVGTEVKAEGELIISGTKGYIYVPAPWWKTDYFEARFENPANNKRYFYQLEGEGIRYMISSFSKTISKDRNFEKIPEKVSIAICRVIEDCHNGVDMTYI